MFFLPSSKYVKRLLSISMIALFLSLCSIYAEEGLPKSAREDINDYVVAAARSFDKDGTHKYWWPRKGESAYDGCTTDVVFMNKKVMTGESKSSTYCCGFTLEIFYKALSQYMQDKKMESAGKFTQEDADKFKKLWFVLKTKGDGPGAALTEYGMGKKIADIKDAKRGDFIQLWRHSGTGHSVIFWDAGKNEKGEITDITYFSTQPGTDGIGLNNELVGPPKGIDLSISYISRVTPPETWK